MPFHQEFPYLLVKALPSDSLHRLIGEAPTKLSQREKLSGALAGSAPWFEPRPSPGTSLCKETELRPEVGPEGCFKGQKGRGAGASVLDLSSTNEKPLLCTG